jgi:hypothetical protein
MKNLYLFALLLFSFNHTFGQLRTTSQNGDWHQMSTWGNLNVPDNTFGSFSNVTVNHTVTVRASQYTLANPLQIDNLFIGTTGSLIVESGAALRIQNGSGSDLTISGSGSFNVGGILLTNAGVSFSGLSVANTIFEDGAELRTTSLNLPIASGYDNLTVYLQNVIGSSTLNSTWSQLTSSTDMIVDCPTLGNAAINFAGYITNLNSLQIFDTDGITGGRVIINYIGTSTLNIGLGGVNVTGESRFYLNYAGSVILNLDGDFTFSPVSAAQFSQSTAFGSGTINFNGGDFKMTNGQWNVAESGSNGVGNFRFNSGSDFEISGGVISESGAGSAQGVFDFNGSSGDQLLSIIPSAFGAGTFNLIINKSAGNVLFTGGLSVTNLTLTSGSLENQSSGSTLAVNGVLSATSGTIDATTPMSLSIGGTGTLPGSIPFTPGSILQNFTLDRSTASLSFSNVSLQDQGSITRMSGSFATAIPALGTYDITYNNAAALTTGAEVPVSNAVLRNLVKQGNGTLNLDRALTINGDLTLATGSGLMAAGNFNVSISGDFISNQNFTMNPSATFTFLTRSPSNVHALSGTGTTLSFGIVSVNGDLSISRSATISGIVTIQAASSIQATAGTATFSGTSTIVNNGTSVSFNSISITGSLTAPLNGLLSIGGNLAGPGTFINNGSTTAFIGNGTSSISGASFTFKNLSVSSSTTLQAAVNVSVIGNIVNDGAINFTSGNLIKNGSGNLSGTGSSSFYGLTINSGQTFTTSNNFSLSGPFSGSGTFTSTGTVSFSGTTAMSGSGSNTFTNIVINPSSSLTSSNIFTVNGLIVNNGTLVCLSTFTKGATGTLSGSGTTTLQGLNILTGATFSASSNFSLSGNFTGTGNFSSSATVTFAGTTTMSGAGSKSFTNIIINGTSLTPSANFSVSGNLTVVAGILNPGNKTTTFNGNTTISGAGGINLNYVVINGSSSVSVPSATVNIHGNLTNNGTFTSSAGTVAFSNNTVGKTIAGSSPIGFYNLTIGNGSPSVDVRNDNTGGVSISGILSLSPGAVLDADGLSNNVLTLLSNSNADGSVGPLLSGASVTGNVSVQRYWGIMDNVYRYISSPVTNSPISQLQTSGIPITGGFSGTSFPCTGCDNDYINLGWYDETVPGYIGAGYKTMPATGNSNTEILVPARGYELYMWNGVASTQWTTRGPINQGSIAFDVSHTPSVPAMETEDGWNLVGNPYPSSIKWEDNTDLPGGWSFTDIDPIAYVWDEAIQGFKYYDHGSGVLPGSGDLTNGIIAKGQAFWVYVNNTGNAAITVHESAKSATNGTFYRTRGDDSQGVKVTLAYTPDSGVEVQDHIFIIDGIKKEVPKLEIGRELISLAVSNDNGKRILYSSTMNDRIPLSVKIRKEGKGKLFITSIGETNVQLNDYYIVDTHLNTMAEAVEGYEFYFKRGESNTMDDRFLLTKKSLQNSEAVQILAYPNPTNGQITFANLVQDATDVSLLNSVGEKISAAMVVDEGGKKMMDLKGLPNGVYFIRLTMRDGYRVQKIIKN